MTLDKNVLIFSNFCNHSTNFLSVLTKHPHIQNTFIPLNIDPDPQTNQRPDAFFQIQEQLRFKITEVPTIIVEGGEYVLSGEQAFKWLEYQINKTNTEQELEGFNSNEMGSFSDSYATFGSTELHDAREQSFKFINKPDQRIDTPQEDGSVTQDDYNRKTKERENFSNTGSGMGGGVPKKSVGPSQRIDFTSSNFGFAGDIKGNGMRGGMGKGGGMSAKGNEIESRLQQLIAQREEIPPGPAQMRM